MKALLVGPVPPPIDGRAVATGWLIDELRGMGTAVEVHDTQGEGLTAPVRKAASCLLAAVRLLVRRPATVLVVASGGAGLVLELVPVAAARLARRPIAVLHHSGSYVSVRSRLMAVLCRLAGRQARHVLLSEGMATQFSSTYGLERFRCLVVDNVALMPVARPSLFAIGGRHSIVHLASLSRAKGSDVVLEVARRIAPQHSCQPDIVLAGPADGALARDMEAARRAGIRFRHLGPVEGTMKVDLLNEARVLLLPSRYRHEAQPLVIYEAAALGVVPVVWSNGWISEQMAALELEHYVLASGDVDGMVSAALSVLRMGDKEFDDLSRRIRLAFGRHRESARIALAHLLQ